jgi:leucyl-tRNA synthetase
MVLAEIYYREDEPGKKVYFNPVDVELQKDEKGAVQQAILIADGKPVQSGGMEKMSKSRNNGVDPQTMIDQYGCDTVRLFTMFAAPPEQSLEWNGDAIAGCSRFLRRVWALYFKHAECFKKHEWQILNGEKFEDKAMQDMRFKTHEIIRKALFDFERNHFNTVVAGSMELTNAIEKVDWSSHGEDGERVLVEACTALLKMLAPIAPHITQEIWEEFGGQNEILDGGWLAVDESALVKDEIKYVVQVNGKLRDEIQVATSASKDDIEALAMQCEGVQRHIEGQTVRKVIVVPNRLVNIVAN